VIVDDYRMPRFVETRFNLTRQVDNISYFRPIIYKFLAQYFFNHTDMACQNQRALFPPPQSTIFYAGIYEIIDHLTRANVKIIERVATAFQSSPVFHLFFLFHTE
jgi:hypothetical protein